jgi:conjugative transfer signal peptidase TraF
MSRGPKYFLLLMAGVASVIAAAGWAGYRLNTSGSMPRGLWYVESPPRELARGVIAVYCLGDRRVTEVALRRHYLGPGSCPTGVEPIIKPVIAVAGDVIGVKAGGIFVNGELLTRNLPLPFDPAGRPLDSMPMGEYLVGANDVWVLSDYTTSSFDSRYYGPVRVSNILGTATPVLVW